MSDSWFKCHMTALIDWITLSRDNIDTGHQKNGSPNLNLNVLNYLNPQKKSK